MVQTQSMVRRTKTENLTVKAIGMVSSLPLSMNARKEPTQTSAGALDQTSENMREFTLAAIAVDILPTVRSNDAHLINFPSSNCRAFSARSIHCDSHANSLMNLACMIR